jgi:hypothetical protein
VKNTSPEGEGPEAGSNKFYIGGGLFADPYTTIGPGVFLPNYAGFLSFVHQEKGAPDLSTLKIDRVARPIIPDHEYK